MYMVMVYDSLVDDFSQGFAGSLGACRDYVADMMAPDADGFVWWDADDVYIVAPDGFTVVD